MNYYILKSFVNIYADDETIYGHTSKIQDDWSLAAALASDLSLTAQEN